MNDNTIRIFNKVCNLKVRDIKLCCHVSGANNDILAFVIGSGDLFLYNLPHDKDLPVLRWLPWFDDIKKRIQALAFSPGFGHWLLIVCNDCSLYIIPALALLNINNLETDNYDWKTDDITCLSSPIFPNSEFIPSAIAWWTRSGYKGELRDVGIMGSKNGHIVIFSIINGSIIVTTKIEGPACHIEVCDQEPNACAIITNGVGHQWRLLFHEPVREQQDQTKSPTVSDSRSSKLLGLKQLSVDTIANIKQRISETRSKSIATILPVECAEGDVVRCGAQWQLNVKLQSVSETSLGVHDKIITATYPANIVAVENYQTEANTVHKLPFSCVQLVLTDSLFIFTSEELNKLYLVSQALSQCRTDSNKHFLSTDFNAESLLQEFVLLKNEVVIKLYCTNYSKDRSVLVSNLGIYTICLSEEPKSIVLKHILSSDCSLRSAEKLSCVFQLDIKQIICDAADILLTQGLVNEATQLYRMTWSGGVRSVVMLAKFGHISEVMTALSSFDFSHSHKPHLANLKVLAFVHQYLTKYSEKLHKDFLDMLNKGGYDESLAVSVLAQAGLCEDLLSVTVQRGLQPITTVALANILKRNYPLNIMKCNGFWELMSEHTLCEALLAKPRIAKIHLNFIQSNLGSLDHPILLRLEELYNPFRISLRPWITYTCQGEVPISLWVQTYILICIHLSSLKKEINLNMVKKICTKLGKEPVSKKPPIKLNPQVIGAGFSHSCIIVHGNAYTWGSTAFGCLGTGPSYPRIIGPTIIDMFPNIGIRVLSVSCGRTHTIVLTNNGVYAWGSNRYGQLGVGNVIQSWFPRNIEFFENSNIIHVSAGQYHSIAIDSNYRVFTWGWGVHGQLGHGNVEDYNVPKIVDSLSNQEITWSCGGHAHTLFLDVNGNVWACGSSVFGQLGTGANIKSSIPLQVFGLPEKIINLSTGYFHSVGLAEGGRVYQWGCSPSVLRAAAHAAKRRLRSHEGSEDCAVQLDDNLSYLSPTLVDTSHVIGEIIKVSAGNEHNVLLTDDDVIFAWGRNMDGQLGYISSESRRKSQHVLHPTQIRVGTRIKDVECGSDFTVAVDIIGNVWTWGANHHSAVNRSALSTLEGEVVVVKNRNRVIKLPHSGMNSQPLPTLLTIPTQHNELPIEIKEKTVDGINESNWETRLHYAIEILHPFYQPSLLIDKCIDLGECNAGAKIAQINDDLVTAVKLHLQSAQSLDFICEVLCHYFQLAINDEEQLYGVLEFVIKFWVSMSLPMNELEVVLKQFWDQLASPLGHLLLRVNGGMADVFSQFSTHFTINVVSYMIEHNDGNLECILSGVENIKDAITAINMSDEFLDIDENLAYESIPYPTNKFTINENSYPSNQGLRKPSLYLK